MSDIANFVTDPVDLAAFWASLIGALQRFFAP